MIGRIALTLVIFFVLTGNLANIETSDKISNAVKLFVILSLLAYISLTIVYFMSQQGWV